MAVILLIIIIGILLIFLSGKIIAGLAEGTGAIVALLAYIAKGVISLIQKIIPKKKLTKVTVFCPCSHSFIAEPKKNNGWIVNCPKCGKALRVNINKKKA